MSLLGNALAVQRPRISASYAGAQHTRLTLDWYGALLSEDRILRAHLRTLRERSRQLIRDDPHASEYLDLLKTNVIGLGIKLQSRVAKTTGDLRRVTNQRIEDAHCRWAEVGVCTVDGRLSFEEAQELYISTIGMDGEVLIRHREAYDNEFGYALQFLDADQLDESFNRPAEGGQNEIRMGVEINRDGRPLFYHLWNGHPSDPGVRAQGRIKVPADQIIHDFLQFRAGQTRGVPPLAPVMFRLKMLGAYEENEIIASRASAAKPVYFKIANEAFADIYSDIEKPTEPLRMEFDPGTATQLPPGLEPVQMDPTHPTSAFEPFQKACLRAIAVGLHVASTSLSGDLRDVNYSSIRAGVLKERDVYRRLQQHVIRHFLTPVHRRWLKWAATTGAVQLPTLDVNRWCQPQWQPRGWAWVDPLNDLQAAQIELQEGLVTRTILAAERGRDFEEMLEQRAEEDRLAKEYGVTLGEPKPPAPVNRRDDAGGGSREVEDDHPDDEAEPAKDKPGHNGTANGHGRNRLAALDLVELT